MTVIVGLKDTNGAVYVGADSISAHNSYKTVSAVPKVFRKGKMLFAFQDSWRMGQVLRYILDIPKFRPDEQSVEGYMVGTFINAVRRAFDSSGYGGKDREGREEGGGFIVAFQGRIFTIEGDYQVNESRYNYSANGAGYAYAEGALSALNEFEMDPVERITLALRAAERHSPFVSAPFTILKRTKRGDHNEYFVP